MTAAEIVATVAVRHAVRPSASPEVQVDPVGVDPVAVVVVPRAARAVAETARREIALAALVTAADLEPRIAVRIVANKASAQLRHLLRRCRKSR